MKNIRFLITLFAIFSISRIVYATESISDISISPNLDISLFSSYTISASISDYASTDTVTLKLSGINGDGIDCWQYYTSGTCASSDVSLNMSYLSGTAWQNTSVRPDYIYPQIYFAPSSLTWNTSPSSNDIRRNNYHIFHITNPFTIIDDMNLWIEINAGSASTINSANLQVYVVGKGHEISFFNSDWRNSSSVQLVASFDKNSAYNHSHSANSKHLLVTLATNADNTIGSNHIDIADEFWVILYANSPNTNRGWYLKYQLPSECTNNNDWYTGDQIGWHTTLTAGCPDVHIHIARKTGVIDGMNAEIVTNNSTNDKSFYFGVIPNLAPNQSTFLIPEKGGTYSGTFNIDWATSTDANLDTLKYDLYLLDSVGNVLGTALVASTSNTILTFDTTSVDNGTYSLKGYVNDGVNSGVEFNMNGTFYILNGAPIRTLSEISIASNNSDTTLAKDGDVVTLSFTASGAIETPTVEIYSGGSNVTGDINVTNTTGNTWTASYTVDPNDTDGEITFNISSSNLNQDYFETTNDSSVSIDMTAPSKPTSSIDSGTYQSTQTVYLSSNSYSIIRYTTDGSIPNCSTGIQYVDSITISSDTNIKSIACDSAGNISNTSSFSFVIKQPIINSSGSSIYSRIYNLTSANNDVEASRLATQWNQLNYYNTLINNRGVTLKTTSYKGQFFKNLYMGIYDDDVKYLQKYLNQKGFILAVKGPGSPGNETNYFGLLTKQALIKFQKQNNIYPPIGYFGPVTREFIKSNQ